DCFWLKANEPSVSWNLCIGGQRPTGEDATNEVTYLCLSAAERLRLQKPNLSFRWHSGTPDSALKRALQVVRLGTGFPAIYNDESLVPALTAIGVTLEDARDYAMGGCSEVSVCAKSHYGNEDGDISITKPLEYALHNGFCVMHKCREGAETGDVATFKTFDDVLTAYKRQVEFCIALLARYCNLGQQARAEHAPRLVKTLLTDDCLERAQTIDEGGARYNGGQFFVIGLANAADSLAAIKKVVFEEKRLSLSDLVAILDRNFEGHEPLRQQLLNAVPKFGNDDPYVDSLMADIAAHCFTTIKQQRAWRGGVYGANVIVLERNIIFGKSLAATPDGRLAGSPVSDSIGPMQGADRQGPTATINSIGRIDQTLAPGGVILNLKFSPKALEGEDGLDKLAALLKRYFALKGQQVQITVVDKATLLAAQREPHNYRHLLVRVGGFSGRFVDFSDELQRQVIARTEHAL
ncbi:MAG: glycyl radical protein, partial [Planctomycetes bacterium]|nr:glycyl radical protein [Planctomycetota bacterium]